MVIEANGKIYLVIAHAEAEMIDDRIKVSQVQAALENAEPQPSRSHPERDIYIYRGIAVVVYEEDQEIITVYRID